MPAPVQAEPVEAFNIYFPHTRSIAAFTLASMRRMSSRLAATSTGSASISEMMARWVSIRVEKDMFFTIILIAA
jgi:hypothetical protein